VPLEARFGQSYLTSSLLQVIKAQWVFRQPYGYVPPGPLFGWNDVIHNNCNSPFWKGVPPMLDRPWNYANNLDAGRIAFWNHAWTEFDYANGSTRVLDVCHGLLNSAGAVVLSLGQQNRVQYLQASINNGADTNQWPPPVIQSKSK